MTCLAWQVVLSILLAICHPRSTCRLEPPLTLMLSTLILMASNNYRKRRKMMMTTSLLQKTTRPLQLLPLAHLRPLPLAHLAAPQLPPPRHPRAQAHLQAHPLARSPSPYHRCRQMGSRTISQRILTVPKLHRSMPKYLPA